MTGDDLLHHLLDSRVHTTPDLPAVTHGDQRLTYGQLHDTSIRLAAWLRRIGVPHGGRVLIAVPPSVIVPALLYAASRAGAIFCVVHEDVTGGASL